jgi:hypothetical protein
MAGLSAPGAWLEADGDGYRLRVGVDRRRRPLLRLDEAAFRALARSPGLALRREGGWRLAQTTAEAATLAPAPLPAPGRPGFVAGERLVAEADGRLTSRRANLGASALAWLAARRDSQGRPWLEPRERAAAERLALDHERAGMIGRLTMDWSAAPRAAAARGRGVEPAEQARAAKDRLAAALAALPGRERAVVQRVVLLHEPLQAVERALRLPRRSARIELKAGLVALACFYRLP